MENVILAEYPEIDYAIIARVEKYKPRRVYEFVCAYLPDMNGEITWAQGHYFKDIEDAIAFIARKFRKE